MKKLLLLILPLFFISKVSALTVIYPIENRLSQEPSSSEVQPFYDYIQSNNISNYAISFNPASNNYYLHTFDSATMDYRENYSPYNSLMIYMSLTNGHEYVISGSTVSYSGVTSSVAVFLWRNANSTTYYSLRLYDSSFIPVAPEIGMELTGFYPDSIEISPNGNIPLLKDLYDHSSWSDYESSVGYSTVNLDNYDYVILSLRDYNTSDSYQTNLQVKGQIGITPVYNFGRTTKDEITGVQVQDRCNISYSDFTSYPFYILSSDIQNNSVFYVKSCASGSSFKYDTSIFDITYVNASNIEDPVITVNGKTYHTIPYEDLPSSATENEANNYIPGQSGSASDTGGLDSAIKTAQNRLSEVWNTFTYFVSLVNQLFSALPSEVSAILISAFAIAIVLGLIKIFVN